MRLPKPSLILKTVAVCLVLGLGIVVYSFHGPIWAAIQKWWTVLSDRKLSAEFIASYGLSAPFLFVGIQILQVLLAPIPGEVTGFIGGYLFGALPGILYSTIGLTVGSCINFLVGRLLGERFVRKWIPAETLKRLDSTVKRQGAIILFFLFVFPGFPKDYLCLFLGITAMPFKLFVLIAGVGRIPGTVMLSLQGAFLFEGNYVLFGILLLLLVTGGYCAFRYRDSLYRWMARFNGSVSP